MAASPQDSQARLFQALASPVRLRILDLLRASGSMTVSELQQRLGIEAANASQHLRVLRDRGLLDRRREGTSVWYSLADPSLLDHIRAIADHQPGGSARADQRARTQDAARHQTAP
jgi:DNA-binding transcriptional ArsR family regulator